MWYLPFGVKAELVVERGDAVDFAGGHLQVAGDPDHGLAREEALGFLDGLQNRDQTVPLGVGEAAQDRVDVVHVSTSFFDFSCMVK